MNESIKEVILTEEVLLAKIEEMANIISKEYQGKELLLIGILKGSVMFMADLMRKINIPVEMDFMAVSSYGYGTDSSGVVRILKDLDSSIKDKHVIIVEDIIDSGITLNYLINYLKNRNPASLEIACLLTKSGRRKIEIDVKYLGFTIPDHFIVGYGLDYAEKFRNLPYIGILKEEIYKK